MNNENEIERMLKLANEATANCKVCNECKFRINGDCCNRKVGEYLCNAGIGDKKQAVKEFAEKLKEIIADNQYRFLNHEENVDPFGVSKEQIDNLITELYGVDE